MQGRGNNEAHMQLWRDQWLPDGRVIRVPEEMTAREAIASDYARPPVDPPARVAVDVMLGIGGLRYETAARSDAAARGLVTPDPWAPGMSLDNLQGLERDGLLARVIRRKVLA